MNLFGGTDRGGRSAVPIAGLLVGVSDRGRSVGSARRSASLAQPSVGGMRCEPPMSAGGCTLDANRRCRLAAARSMRS
jgi:hypothetical protein